MSPQLETSSAPFVSVVVPVFNDGVRLARCLAALARQTYPADAYEVIVVDNGSTAPVSEFAGVFLHARLVTEPRPGVSQARVTGIEHARGEVLAFTDSDCLPEPTWIANGVARLAQVPNGGVVAGRIEMFADEPGPPSVATTLSVATHLQQDRFVRGGFAVCANLFASRNVFDSAGTMNPALISSGEVEWCHRVRLAGYDLVYEPTAVVRHPARASSLALCRRAMRHEFAWAQLRATAGLGHGARYWAMQHLAWPLRDIYKSLIGNARLTVVQKAQTTALALLLMLVRVITWLLMRLGFKYDVRANWG